MSDKRVRADAARERDREQSLAALAQVLGEREHLLGGQGQAHVEHERAQLDGDGDLAGAGDGQQEALDASQVGRDDGEQGLDDAQERQGLALS